MDKHTISSFAAPTDADIAAFEAMSEEEKRAVIFAELDKGIEGQPVPLTDDLEDQISAKVAKRLKLYVPS